MKEIVFYNDKVHNLIMTGEYHDIDSFYDKVENYLLEGYEVNFGTSEAAPELPYLLTFHTIETFEKWRKKKKDENDRLNNLFTPGK
jgi:hypothetical protein